MLQAILGAFALILEVLAIYTLPLSISIVILLTRQTLNQVLNYIINKAPFTSSFYPFSFLMILIGVLLLIRPELI
jgi:hypothetical protein